MPFESHLTETEIDAIRNTAIALGLAGSRDALLSGLPESYQASLPRASNPADQIHLDLQTMNKREVLEGSQAIVPLASWLSTAHQFRSFASEAKVFKQAMDKIAQNARVRAAASAQEPPATMPDAGFVATSSPPAHAVRSVATAPKQPISTTPFPATAIFVSIAGLTKMAGPEVPDALAALHKVLRAPIDALRGSRVLSSVTGAIVLVPDALNRNVHEPELLPAWLSAIDAAGLAVHAGVAWGQTEWVVDADGTINATGRGINIAARLAASELNPGVLYQQSYVDQVSGVLRRNHFLFEGNQPAVSVKGKRDEVFVCVADPAFRTRASNDIPEGPAVRFVNAVLLAYDLPGFSDGDLRTLASRFRGVSDEIHRLREQQSLPSDAHIAFSPGGDGGVLAITGIPLDRAYNIATDLTGKLVDANETRTTDASVRARIGVHYGPTHSYVNAEGITRPTGHALFEADGIAGDDDARSWDSIVVSGALIEGPSARWHEITPFETALKKRIRRFVDSHARHTPPARTAAAPPATVAMAATSATTTAQVSPPSNLRWPTKLTGPALQALCTALRSAFPKRAMLTRMLREQLGKSLDEIAGEGDLKQTVFEVVTVAEAEGWIPRLFDAAIAAAPDNAELRTIAEARRA